MSILGRRQPAAAPQVATTIHLNGKQVAQYYHENADLVFGSRKHRQLDADAFAGPKLKLERAKKHIAELKSAIREFMEPNAYEVVVDQDAQTGENIFRVKVNKAIPAELSGIIGDAVHNLRCVLDFLVCDLIRANGETPNGGSGLPLKSSGEKLKPGSIAKIQGVSAKAEGRILRLKRYRRWNRALYDLNMLDVFDKHNCIVPTACATFVVRSHVALPFGIDSAGNLSLGTMHLHEAGAPKHGHVYPVHDGIEIYRSPAGLDEYIEARIHVAFGEGEVLKGEPIFPSLIQFSELIERILILAERTAL